MGEQSHAYSCNFLYFGYISHPLYSVHTASKCSKVIAMEHLKFIMLRALTCKRPLVYSLETFMFLFPQIPSQINRGYVQTEKWSPPWVDRSTVKDICTAALTIVMLKIG